MSVARPVAAGVEAGRAIGTTTRVDGEPARARRRSRVGATSTGTRTGHGVRRSRGHKSRSMPRARTPFGVATARRRADRRRVVDARGGETSSVSVRRSTGWSAQRRAAEGRESLVPASSRAGRRSSEPSRDRRLCGVATALGQSSQSSVSADRGGSSRRGRPRCSRSAASTRVVHLVHQWASRASSPDRPWSRTTAVSQRAGVGPMGSCTTRSIPAGSVGGSAPSGACRVRDPLRDDRRRPLDRPASRRRRTDDHRGGPSSDPLT